MCVIVCGRNKDIAEKDIEAMWEANSHGAGVAWNNGSEVMYRKGFMKLKELTDFLATNGKIFKRDWLIHFRLASSGGNSAMLTHPFIVDDELSNRLQYCGRNPVLAHNGHDNFAIDKMKDMVINNKLIVPEGNWSDSRAIAYILSFCGKNACNLFSGKFAFMTPDKIHLFGSWEEKEGYYYSNMSWKHSYLKYTNYCYQNSYFDNFPDTDRTIKSEKEKKQKEDDNKYFANNLED